MPSALFVVLTSEPGAGALTEAHVAMVREALADAASDDARWLAPGEAWEMRLTAEGRLIPELRARLAQAMGSAPVDVNVVRGDPASRRKRLLCADMESTVIEQELIDEIATLVGCHDGISAITAAAMRGEIDFADSLRRRVALLAGIETRRLEPIRAHVSLMPGAETLVRTMAGHGATCALVSGGFTLFADEIGRKAGFAAVAANVLDVAGGTLTGRVREPVLGPAEKAHTLKRLAAEGGIALADTVAVGDGANDVAMIEAAGLGVAFRAKPMLADRARALETGAVIAHGDLTALLYLQGYSRDTFLA